jgi:secondary thiamine-phosphate synthase enzyme
MEGQVSEVTAPVTRHHARSVWVDTRGRGTFEITDDVQGVVAESMVRDGICNVFVHHTSASLIICENADPTVRSDLERFAARLVPDGDRIFEHDAEGPDDMPAHIRSILTATSLTLPIAKGRCELGTWQGVFVWEHRRDPHRRRVTISVLGS